MVAEYGPIVPMPTSPAEYKKFEAAILGVVPGRQYGEDQTPVHRRVQLQIWAQHDAHRRKCNTMFRFWKVCPDGACKRAKSCAGNPHACFFRWWPHVPQDFKISFRAIVKAMCAGASAKEAARAGHDAVARAHELDERFSQFDVMMKGESVAAKPAPTDIVARREPPLPRARFV